MNTSKPKEKPCSQLIKKGPSSADYLGEFRGDPFVERTSSPMWRIPQGSLNKFHGCLSVGEKTTHLELCHDKLLFHTKTLSKRKTKASERNQFVRRFIWLCCSSPACLFGSMSPVTMGNMWPLPIPVSPFTEDVCKWHRNLRHLTQCTNLSEY